MTWWQRLVAWLTGSEPGNRKEQVENWIASNGPKLDAFRDRQVERLGRKGHYFQRLQGWLRPTDDDEDPINDFLDLPVWVEVGLDVYERPAPSYPPLTEKGYTLRVYVTEADTTTWVLSIDSNDGSLGWAQILPLT